MALSSCARPLSQGLKTGLFAVILLASAPVGAEDLLLNGFFGDPKFTTSVESALAIYAPGSPLPPGWLPAVPVKTFEGNHRPLYLDSQLSSAGDDLHETVGIEVPTLAFYMGHGSPGHFSTPDERNPEVLFDVELPTVRVGDGALRYFWLHSCNVLAHGGNSSGDFAEPYLSPKERDENAFDRWQGSVAKGLRMVCAGSTRLGYAHAEEIWDYLLARETTVADAFILGLGHEQQVPACLAPGGPDPSTSALNDRTLERGAPSVAPSPALHLQYPVPCDVTRAGTGFSVRCGEGTTAAPIPAPQTAVTSLPEVTIGPPCRPPHQRERLLPWASKAYRRCQAGSTTHDLVLGSFSSRWIVSRVSSAAASVSGT